MGATISRIFSFRRAQTDGENNKTQIKKRWSLRFSRRSNEAPTSIPTRSSTLPPRTYSKNDEDLTINRQSMPRLSEATSDNQGNASYNKIANNQNTVLQKTCASSIEKNKDEGETGTRYLERQSNEQKETNKHQLKQENFDSQTTEYENDKQKILPETKIGEQYETHTEKSEVQYSNKEHPANNIKNILYQSEMIKNGDNNPESPQDETSERVSGQPESELMEDSKTNVDEEHAEWRNHESRDEVFDPGHMDHAESEEYPVAMIGKQEVNQLLSSAFGDEYSGLPQDEISMGVSGQPESGLMEDSKTNVDEEHAEWRNHESRDEVFDPGHMEHAVSDVYPVEMIGKQEMNQLLSSAFGGDYCGVLLHGTEGNLSGFSFSENATSNASMSVKADVKHSSRNHSSFTQVDGNADRDNANTFSSPSFTGDFLSETNVVSRPTEYGLHNNTP